MKIKPKVKKYGDGGKNKDTEYLKWKSKLPKNLQYEGDYDLRGFYNENSNFNVNDPNQHLTDRYKLPNHPTFSNESKYFNMVQPQILNQAGYWDETDSSYNYIPYNTMYKDTIIEKKKNGGSINKYPNGGREPIVGTPRQYQAYQDSLFIHNDGERMRNLLINPSTNENTYANEVNRYYTGTLLNTNNPTNQALSRLTSLNNEFPEVEARQNRTFPSGYTAYASLFKKPVQPITLKPSATTTVGDVVGDKIAKSKDNVAVLNSELIPKNRPKEPTFELNQEQQYLPQKEQQLEFDPIGLKKGTYFTRPRQQQEAGQGKMDYFDNKTGKFLKTREFGGNITKESEWELVNETNKKLPKRRLNLNKSSDWEIVD